MHKTENLEAIILAAGKSSRMGKFKPLLPFLNSTIIEHSINRAAEVANKVLVVIGFRGDDIIHLKKWDKKIKFVKNPEPERGMFSSIFEGVAKSGSGRVFIGLGDQPHIKKNIYKKLANAGKADVVQPVYNARPGHPLLISENVKKHILNNKDSISTITLKNILVGFKKNFVEVDNDSILTDLDTITQYKEMIKKELD